MVFYVLESNGNKIVDPPTYNLLNGREEGSDVLRDTYRTLSEMTRGTCMVRIHSNGCIHCHNMKKDYMGLNTDLLKHINILDIEVGSDDYRNHNSSWVAETRNKGVPHIFIMKNEKVLDEYSGNRTTQDMVDFIGKHVKTDDARSKPVRSNKLSKLPSSIAIYKKTFKKNKKRKRGKTGKKPKKNKKRKPNTR